jgi:hypothetical protein
MPLCPGYLFVHISPQEDIQAFNASGVVPMVCQGCTPAALPDQEADVFRFVLQPRMFQPPPYRAVETKARISKGQER